MEKHYCETCGYEHDGSYGSGRFCSDHCRRVYLGKCVKNRKTPFSKGNNYSKAKDGGWKCPYCGEVFRTRREKQAHVKQSHAEMVGVAWNKGLTKETNSIVEQRAETWKKNLADGKFKPTWADRKQSEETKTKIRKSTIAYLKECDPNWRARYNKSSIPIIERIGQENGWCFQHAENGGEFETQSGYFLDAYDPVKNVVLEFDEAKHYKDAKKNLLVEKDIARQNKIIEELQCEFYRYNSVTNTLWKISEHG